MRILYTGTYNSVLSFLVWNVIIYTYHNTRLYVTLAVQLYLFTFHLHKRCIIIILLVVLVGVVSVDSLVLGLSHDHHMTAGFRPQSSLIWVLWLGFAGISCWKQFNLSS